MCTTCVNSWVVHKLLKEGTIMANEKIFPITDPAHTDKVLRWLDGYDEPEIEALYHEWLQENGVQEEPFTEN